VATNPACFAEADFHDAHDAMLCIANSSYVDSDDRIKSSPDAWIKPAREMRLLFADLPEALSNTLVVAQRCAVMAPKREPDPAQHGRETRWRSGADRATRRPGWKRGWRAFPEEHHAYRAAGV
jgi:DNA polymerase-3 subunit alpha